MLRQFVAFSADGRWFMLALMSAGITPESALPAVICDPIARLFRDHLDEVVSFLARRVRCPAAAEDLAQESYVRLLRRGTLPHDGNLPAYLRRIAERLAVDYLRQQRRAVATWAPLSDDLPSPAPRPDAIAELRELCEIVLDAIADLPRRTRCVLLLRKVDDMSYGDIAARLGIAEKTVQAPSRQRYAPLRAPPAEPASALSPVTTADLTIDAHAVHVS